jgi:hypothetical protein
LEDAVMPIHVSPYHPWSIADIILALIFSLWCYGTWRSIFAAWAGFIQWRDERRWNREWRDGLAKLYLEGKLVVKTDEPPTSSDERNLRT